MKKLVMSAALLLCLGTAVQAQEKQMWIGGHVGFTNIDVKDGGSATSFSIMPEFGYRLSHNWAVGIRAGYEQAEIKNAAGNKTKTSGFEIEPFARYSFLQGNVGGMFIDGVLGYGQSKAGSVKTDSFGVEVRPGVAINLSPCLVLTGSVGILGYNHSKSEGVKTNTISADFDLNDIQLGLAFRF